MTLQEAITDYLTYLKHEQGAAKTPYKSYHAYLQNFLLSLVSGKVV